MVYLELKQEFNSVKHRPAVIFYDENFTKIVMTYEDVIHTCDRISEFLTKTFDINSNCGCMGLKMSHNIFIPSIILSLRRYQFPFIFLDDSNSGVDRLGIRLVLSLNIAKIKDFEVVKSLDLKYHNYVLYVFQRNHIPKPTSLSDCFCVVRTSGTTGESKFIKVKNTCIRDNIDSLSDTFRITQDDVIYFGTPLTFDPSLVELLLALTNKACLLVVCKPHQINPTSLYKCLFPTDGADAVTVLQMVPSLFHRWSEGQIHKILTQSNLRVLAFGGEPFPDGRCKYSKSPDLRVFNLYGITEVSCWATVHEKSEWIEDEDGTPIGTALGDTLIEVRDSDGLKITQGEGEIYIGSASRFCLVDNEEEPPDLPIFRATGDLAVINTKGIFYKGRKNDSFKRFGHKLVLSKIEELIFKETALRNCCVWARNESKLLCFLEIDQINKNVHDKIVDKIRVELLHSLPREWFPDFFDIIPKFPLTCHGKLDRRKLEAVYLNRGKIDGVTSSDVFEQLIRKYLGIGESQWAGLLSSTFFEIGGNSVLIIQLLSELSDQLNTNFCTDLVELLFASDLKSCIEYMENVHPPKQKRKTLNSAPPSSDTAKKKKIGSASIQINWKYNMDACVDCTPLVFTKGEDTFVAVGSFSRIFAVLNATSGEEVAKFTLPDVVEAAACLSPCTSFLCVPCFDGNVHCLDYSNHKIRWQYSTLDRIKCVPKICRDSTAIVFGSYDKHIHCISIEDGSLIWRTSVCESVASSPLIDQTTERIYIATILGTCLCLSEHTGTVIWSAKCGTPVFGSPCITNKGQIVWADVRGTLHCFTLEEGLKIWTFSASAYVYSSLISYNDFIIFGCHDSNVYVLNSQKSTDAELSYLVPVDSAISSTVFLWNCSGKIFVSVATNNGGIFLIDFDKGELEADFKLPAEIFSSPVINNGKLYVGCRDNNLYCLDILIPS